MKDKHKNFFIKLFKYLPPVSVLLLTIHIALLIHGITIPVTQYFIDSSFFGGSLMIASSILFDMCPLHKCCIWYTIVVTLLIDLQRAIGLGILLTPLRYVTLVVGIILCVLLIIKYFKTKKKNNVRIYS